MFSILIASAICTFSPPESWEIAQLKVPSPHIQIGFIGKGSNNFRPSLSLSIEEEVDASLKEYVKAVKEIHTAEPNTKWRDLGKIQTLAGEGRLVEISRPSSYGEEMVVLQAMLVK